MDDAVAQPDTGEEEEGRPRHDGDSGGVLEDPDVVDLREGHERHDESYT